MSESQPGPKPKSHELLQAQAAAFAAEKLTHTEDQQYVLNHVGQLAAEGRTDVRRTTQSKEFIRHPDGSYERNSIPAGTEVQVATPEEYDTYVREVGGRRHEPIAVRTELLEAYPAFDGAVEKFLADVSQHEDPTEHPGYLASGLNVKAFRMEHDGRDYVVRQTHQGRPESGAGIDARLQPHTRRVLLFLS